MLKLKTWAACLLAGLLLLSACVVRETPVSTQTTAATTTTTTTVAERERAEEKFFENNEVYFWVDTSVFTQDTEAISKMLNHPSGWSRSGLKFTETKDRDAAHIVIYPKDSWKEVVRLCANVENAAGCAGQYITISGNYKCTVYLRMPSKRLSFEGFLSILNHETGHCLGVGHSTTKGDLMYKSASYRHLNSVGYPTDNDIKQVKEFIEYLKEIKKRFNR